MKSKHLERFKRLVTEERSVEYSPAGHPMNVVNTIQGPMQLKGDMMLVEKLPKIEKKTASGIIIADHKQYKGSMGDDEAEFGVVLMVGPGQILEDGTILSPDCRPGDVILLPGNVMWYSQFGHLADYDPYSIGRLRDSQVGMIFTDYEKAFEVLNNG